MKQAQIKLYFSNSVEKLARELADNLKLEFAVNADVFSQQKIVVPNSNMQRYLQLAISEHNTVCANIQFPFLEQGLFEGLTTLDSSLNKSIKLLNQKQIVLMIFKLLSNNSLINSAEFSLFKRYLGASKAKLRSNKLWQLCSRLSARIIDYELQRPEMIQAWQANTLFFKNSKDQTLKNLEKAQKAIYLALFEKNGIRDQILPECFTLFQYYHQIKVIKSNTVTTELHLFTPTRLSQFHRQLFCYLGRFVSLSIYQLNVCCEYWEDMQTLGEDIWLKRLENTEIVSRDADGNLLDIDLKHDESQWFNELADSKLDNDLLKAWAKPGREALKLYSQLEDDALHFDLEFSNDWLDLDYIPNNSLLHLIQDDILIRKSSANEIKSAEHLRSLQITNAPSVYREIEAVYNSILYNMQCDESLQLTDIAVLSADMDRYRLVFQQVFENKGDRYARPLPYSLIDSFASTDSLYAKAVLDLFAVLEEDFIRKQVFELFQNPCFQTGCHFNHNTLNKWLDAAQQMGIFSGYDHLYANSSDNKNLHQLYTWEQGLARLRLSLVTISDDETILNSNEIGQLSQILESLYRWKFLLNSEMNAQNWRFNLIRFFDELLDIPADNEAESVVQLALFKSLDDFQLVNTNDFKLSYFDLKQYIEQELADIPASRGSYLSAGVVIASLQPMRPIPFKLVYIVGLDEKTFPGSMPVDVMDLSQRSRRIGDINKIESMNYLFLETLICTRNKLYLSYVGRDLKKGEEIFPSPVIRELTRYCSKRLGKPFQITELPLMATDTGSFQVQSNDFADIHFNFSLRDYLIAKAEQGSDKMLNYCQSLLKDNNSKDQMMAQIALDAYKDMASNDSFKNFNGDKVITIDLNDLCVFLENPYLATLKHFGISKADRDDYGIIAHEPFELSGLDKYQIFTSAAKKYLDDHAQHSLLDSIKSVYQPLRIRSEVVINLFADLEALAKLDEKTQLSELKESLQDLNKLDGPVVLGKVKTKLNPSRVYDALQLTLPDNRQINLVGQMENIYLDHEGKLSATTYFSSSSNTALFDKRVFLPYLMWCCLKLQGKDIVCDEFKAHGIFVKNIKTAKFNFVDDNYLKIASTNQLTEYLIELVSDYLQMQSVYLPALVLNDLKAEYLAEHDYKVRFKPIRKKIHAFADVELYKNDQYLQDKYLEKCDALIKKNTYDELPKLIDLQYMDNALEMYEKRFLALYYFAMGLNK